MIDLSYPPYPISLASVATLRTIGSKVGRLAGRRGFPLSYRLDETPLDSTRLDGSIQTSLVILTSASSRIHRTHGAQPARRSHRTNPKHIHVLRSSTETHPPHQAPPPPSPGPPGPTPPPPPQQQPMSFMPSTPTLTRVRVLGAGVCAPSSREDSAQILDAWPAPYAQSRGTRLPQAAFAEFPGQTSWWCFW